MKKLFISQPMKGFGQWNGQQAAGPHSARWTSGF